MLQYGHVLLESSPQPGEAQGKLYNAVFSMSSASISGLVLDCYLMGRYH